MILRYSFGKMIETDAVPVKPIAQEGLPARLAADEASMSFSMPLGEKDVVYGLGENVRGINKRGWFYRSNFWMAFIYVGIVLVLAFFIDAFKTRKDIEFINSRIKDKMLQ